jgi:hypothetical protein
MEQAVREEKSKLYFRLMLALSGVSYALLLIFHVLRWTIADELTGFIAFFLGFLAYALFYGMLVVSFFYVLFTRSNRYRLRNSIPLIVGLVVLGIALEFPYI